METEYESWKPRRVLVGFDGSDGGKDAVRLAQTLCKGSDAEILLVNVLPFPGPPPVAYELLGYEDAPAWKTFFREAEETLRGLSVRHVTYVASSPAKVLNDVAEEGHSDLVVVGSPHRGAIGRAVLGSVAEGLLHGASAPVVVAPHGYRERVHDGFARILVAYDGSAEADVALRNGAAIALREDRELHIVSVTTPPTAAPGPFAGPIPSKLPDAHEVVRRGVRSVGDEVDVRGKALKGAVVPELAAYCGPEDLMIAGSRSYGPIARTFLGSVSSALIHAAPCPVLVFPRPRHAGEEKKDPAAETAEAV
jgi:nucleotide-binding universal stress UspA family protein